MRNRSALLSAGTAALIGGSLVAGCTAGTGAVTAPGPDEQHALQSLRGQLTGPTAVSPVFADGAAHEVAIAVMKQLTNPAVPEVEVYRWARASWNALAQVTLDVGGSVAADSGTTTPIATADITPARVPDLLVTVHYNAGPATAVVSELGGRWHALTFHGGLVQDGTERFDVTVGTDGSLRSRENDCIPDCADGHAVTTVYRFDPVTGRLVAQTSR
jgi:hypothetical protein